MDIEMLEARAREYGGKRLTEMGSAIPKAARNSVESQYRDVHKALRRAGVYPKLKRKYWV